MNKKIKKGKSIKSTKPIKSGPLTSATMITSIIGFVVSVLYLPKFSTNFSISFAIVFLILLIASLISVSQVSDDERGY